MVIGACQSSSFLSGNYQLASPLQPPFWGFHTALAYRSASLLQSIACLLEVIGLSTGYLGYVWAFVVWVHFSSYDRELTFLCSIFSDCRMSSNVLLLVIYLPDTSSATDVPSTACRASSLHEDSARFWCVWLVRMGPGKERQRLGIKGRKLGTLRGRKLSGWP